MIYCSLLLSSCQQGKLIFLHTKQMHRDWDAFVSRSIRKHRVWSDKSVQKSLSRSFDTTEHRKQFHGPVWLPLIMWSRSVTSGLDVRSRPKIAAALRENIDYMKPNAAGVFLILFTFISTFFWRSTGVRRLITRRAAALRPFSRRQKFKQSFQRGIKQTSNVTMISMWNLICCILLKL